MSDDRDVDAADATMRSDAVSRPTGKRSSRRNRAVDAASSGTEESGSSVATAVRSRPASSSDKPKAAGSGRVNPFKRLRRFLREVVAELRKVIWPNRQEMITYTTVVLVFVIFMVAFIYGLDLAFFKGVSWLFG